MSPSFQSFSLRYLAVLLILMGGSTFFAPPAAAQNPGAAPGSVSGSIKDASTGKPVAAASVALWQAADSSLVTGAITKADGSFQIEGCRPGNYYLRVSFVGYDTKIISDVTVSTKQPDVDLGEITLQGATSELDEVQVSGERSYMEIQTDKTVYNTQNQPVTAGGSARDVLENLPSVEVDIDGNISLRGNQNVAIHLNGKPAPMSGEALTSFLEGLSASDIKRVEVIPNPSARYDPEGMSGIINIVLAEDHDIGWGGGVSASAGTRGGYSGSVNAHYGSGPWNLFANYSPRYRQREYGGDRFLEYQNPASGVAPLLQQNMRSESDGFSHTLNTSIDYQLSEKNALSLSTVFSYRRRDENETTRYLKMNADRDPVRRYDRTTSGESSDFSMDYRLSFKRTIQPRKHTFSVEARYEEDRDDDDERYDQLTLPVDNPDAEGSLVNQQSSNEDENEREGSIKVDYKRPLLDDQAHVETGLKSDFEMQDSELLSSSWNEMQTLMPDTNNTFNYSEQIHAAYGTLGGEKGDFGVQGGLRVERALTTFDQRTLDASYDNNYFSLFPSAHLNYKPTQSNNFKLSYSKRVQRPRTWQLNPLSDNEDPTFTWHGNPKLKPEYTHSFEVGYSRLAQSYTLRLTPYYRHTTNAISREEKTSPQGVTTITFENFSTRDSYGTEVIGSLTLGKWLKGNVSLNAYKRVTDGSNLSSELSSDAVGFRTRASGTIQAGRGVTIQLSQFYRSPMNIPGGHIESFTRTNLAVKKKLFGGRGSLSARLTDAFDTMGFKLEAERQQYYQTFSRDFNAQSIQLSLRYNFGQKDKKRHRPPQGGGDEGGGQGW